MAFRGSFALAAGGMAAMAAALGVGRFVYTPILPEMLQGLDWSASIAGLVASANYLGYLAGALAVAFGVFSGNPRQGLLLAVLASALTTGAVGLCDDWIAVSALRAVGGFASSVMIVTASTVVLRRLDAAGAAGLSAVHFAGVGLGIAISAMLVSVLIDAGQDWRTLWYGAGAISLLALPYVAWAIPPEPTRAAAPGSVGGRKPNPQGLWLMIVAYGLFGFGYVITATFLVAIVRDNPAIREIEPWIWSIVGLAALPSVTFWGWLGRRIGLMPGFAAASATLAVGVVASVEWQTFAGVVVSAALLGGTFMGLTALGLMSARQLAAGEPQRAIGQMTASFALGQAVAPALAGWLADLIGGYRAPSLLAAAAALGAAALALCAARICRAAR